MRNYVSRPWGWFQVLRETPVNAVKVLCVKPGERLSLQTHRRRSEIWYPLSSGLTAQIGDDLYELNAYNRYEVPVGLKHRLINDSDHEVQVVELIIGNYDENDISRIEDDYGRS